jgi:hypothetical protein
MNGVILLIVTRWKRLEYRASFLDSRPCTGGEEVLIDTKTFCTQILEGTKLDRVN